MKIGVILGRGVEGVGLTKNVVEFQKLFPGVEVYATIDKLWQRMNSMDSNITSLRNDTLSNFSQQMLDFKKEYMENLRLSLTSNVSDKIEPLVKEQMQILLERTTSMLHDTLPKNNTALQESVKTTIASFSNEIDGNAKKLSASGGLGLIASRLTIEGPIKQDTSSFIVSGRRTYIDVLTKPFVDTTSFEGSSYYFYDLTAKANYRINNKNQIFLSGYFGRDVFNFNSEDWGFSVNIPWGNSTASLRIGKTF